MKNLLFLLLLLGLTTLFSCDSCKGEDGLQGAPGAPGAPGQDGNANISSFTYTVYESEWLQQSAYWSWAPIENIPILTPDVVNNGMVMVYAKDPLGSSWVAWPYTIGSHSYTYVMDAYSIYLHHNTTGLLIDHTYTFRIVAATADGLVRNLNLDWNDYEAVKQALQLPD